jgi:hypothetical protein
MAYSKLGLLHEESGETETSREYSTKASALRDGVSPRERFYISAWYYEDVSGEADKVIDTYQLREQTYPHDDVPHNNLVFFYRLVGQFDRTVAKAQEATGFPGAVERGRA